MRNFSLIFAVIMLAACSNRYLKDYSGTRNSDGNGECAVVNAGLESLRSGKSFASILDEYKAQGYQVLGVGEGRTVRNKKHVEKLTKACNKIGGDLALYDNASEQIVYLLK